MFKKIYLIVINFILLYFNIRSEVENEDKKDLLGFKKNEKNIKCDESNIDRTKYSKIEIGFNYSKKEAFCFYLPKGTYNWNSFLKKCKEFAENPQYSESYKYIKDNNIFNEKVFKFDLYGVHILKWNDDDDVKKNKLSKCLKNHKLEGDFNIDKDYSFGFTNGSYSLRIFRDCKLKDEYYQKYEEIRYNIKFGNYEKIMKEINDCFGRGIVLGIYYDEKCTKEIENAGENLTKVNVDYIFLKFSDDCYEVLYYDYNLDLDDDDKGNDNYSFNSKSSYDSRDKNNVSIYDFFKDLCKNEIRYNNLRYNFGSLGGYLYSDLDDFEKDCSILKKVIIIGKNGKETEINNIEDFKTTVMNRECKYNFILYKNNNIFEFEFLTEKGEKTIFDNMVYDYRDYVPEYLKEAYKDNIDVYGHGILPLKVNCFNVFIKEKMLLKILKVDNGENVELPIENSSDRTINLDYPLLSGKYKVILDNKYSKTFQKKLEEANKRIDKILEEEEKRRKKSYYDRIC